MKSFAIAVGSYSVLMLVMFATGMVARVDGGAMSFSDYAIIYGTGLVAAILIWLFWRAISAKDES